MGDRQQNMNITPVFYFERIPGNRMHSTYFYVRVYSGFDDNTAAAKTHRWTGYRRVSMCLTVHACCSGARDSRRTQGHRHRCTLCRIDWYRPNDAAEQQRTKR